MTAQYVLGIDLGTTNCVLGYTRLDGEAPEVRLLDVPQLVSPGTLESRASLPSFLTIGTEHALGHDGLDLPWAEGRKFAVGELSRRQSAEMPERTVTAAKSWLCHSRIDRREPILPWSAPDDVERISPVVATRRYLEHLIAAWHAAIPDAPVTEQKVILTVPASFDAAARDLTREAALSAGLPSDLILIEEPQAAVYAWLDACGDRWRDHLRPGDKLLVCDVGGGTTDLTLIDVTEENGELALTRLAVGNHRLVGGDNMDLALAHHVAGAFAEKGVHLDAWQSVSLWHAARSAKESLLANDGPDTHPISVLGRGRRVIGGTVSVDVRRDEVANLLADGFFPRCQRTDRPERARVSGFQEMGLPFESNTAITQHLAEFLGDHAQVADDLAMPSRVLFNGGVFKASLLRSRLLDVLCSWCDEGSLARELEGERDLDHAVARGAAYYGWAKEHRGVRIRGGVARSYYVGIETAGLAIPGAPRPLKALCVVPFGMEEGDRVDIPSGEIGVVLGEPAHFRFFSSAIRKQDQPGDVLERWSDEALIETDSLETVLPADEEIDEPYVPVRFQSHITELGVFELWCVSTQTDRRWKLEFSVRESHS